MKPATTISKVCRILSEFRARPSMGVTELARRTDLLPSDVHRILNSLAAFGFIEQNSGNKTYRLGISLTKLGLTALQRNEMRECSRPVLQKLSEQTEANAHFAIFDAREPDIFLAEQICFGVEAPVKSRCGAAVSPHCTALGKAIAASLQPDAVAELIRKCGLPRHTPQTIIEPAELERELAITQIRGYGLDMEESAEGACCVGAVVCDWHGLAVGAVSVSMPAHRFGRFPEAEIAGVVRDAAAQLSAVFGSGQKLANQTAQDRPCLSARPDGIC